jgi:hypothetical protein
MRERSICSRHRRGCTLGAAVAAALIALPLAQTAAQTVLVQNIDEPGRNPYQETVQGGFHNSAGFQISFNTVPLNTRRVIKHVNCGVVVQAQHVISGANLYASDLSQQEALPTVNAKVSGGSPQSIFAENPELYLNTGQFPYIFVFTNDPAAGIICRLSGYDVNLAPPAPAPQSQTQPTPTQP